MLNRTRVLAVALLASVGVASALVRQGQGISGEVHHSKAFELSTPLVVTAQDMADAAVALAKDSPLPTGWELEDDQGTVSAKLTGLVDPATGRSHFTVSVTDDLEDLHVARLFVDGVLQSEATRTNGGIVVRSSSAAASLSGILPAQYGYKVRVEWVSEDGLKVVSRSVSPH